MAHSKCMQSQCNCIRLFSWLRFFNFFHWHPKGHYIDRIILLLQCWCMRDFLFWEGGREDYSIAVLLDEELKIQRMRCGYGVSSPLNPFWTNWWVAHSKIQWKPMRVPSTNQWLLKWDFICILLLRQQGQGSVLEPHLCKRLWCFPELAQTSLAGQKQTNLAISQKRAKTASQGKGATWPASSSQTQRVSWQGLIDKGTNAGKSDLFQRGKKIFHWHLPLPYWGVKDKEKEEKLMEKRTV